MPLCQLELLNIQHSKKVTLKWFDNRRAQLFCDYCKRTGHTIDKCFKIHGYLKPHHKGRGGHAALQGRKTYNAYNTWATSEQQETPFEPQVLNLPRLNPKQSKQLCQFLTNLIHPNQQRHSDYKSVDAHMASIVSPMTTAYNYNIICCSWKLKSGSWLLDSGASDHISFDINALHDLMPLEKPVLVSLPNGYNEQVTHHGKIRVNDTPVLDHLLLVPHF